VTESAAGPLPDTSKIYLSRFLVTTLHHTTLTSCNPFKTGWRPVLNDLAGPRDWSTGGLLFHHYGLVLSGCFDVATIYFNLTAAEQQ
jgi:hypothetical protein